MGETVIIPKNRVVANVRDLNTASVRDIYPISNQDEIITMIHRYSFLTIINTISFFFQ